MLVSWDWLSDYVDLTMTPDEAALRLAMSGLNHEQTKAVGDDWAIDLEVTSNRPDCLGHIGVARELAVLWETPLRMPAAQPSALAGPVDKMIKVRIDCPDLCPRYTARVIKGVRVGPSPDWMRARLATIGVQSINNVVDATNYVMMEFGQPLHAFDLAQLHGPEIIVREARNGEEFAAIDHRSYPLQPGMCVIADRDRSVALGGVMGGVDSEVSDVTTEVLIEAAAFQPLSIRTTARHLKLHSPSSYRFERGVDWESIDAASRRCCELILEMAGGELAEGVVDVMAQAAPPRESITLRYQQVPRVLGIEVSQAEIHRILKALGNTEIDSSSEAIEIVPPSWRRDLTREIDLIEEIARIHGYDEIPEDVGVPMAPSYRHDDERVRDRIRRALTASGFDEAMTASMVTDAWSKVTSPWTNAPAIQSSTPMLEGADRLRRSLVPSLLNARKRNESLSNQVVELFETAKVYLPRAGQLPEEPWMLALTSGRGFQEVKGILQSLLQMLNASAVLETADCDLPLLAPDGRCYLICQGQRLGYLGVLNQELQNSKLFSLRAPTTVAEMRMDVLEKLANLIPQFQAQSAYPPVTRDLNLILDESVRWSDLSNTVRQAAGELLEQLDFREIYRDPDKDGAGKKRMIFSFRLRSDTGTLTGDQADAVSSAVVAACEKQHQAQLLA